MRTGISPRRTQRAQRNEAHSEGGKARKAAPQAKSDRGAIHRGIRRWHKCQRYISANPLGPRASPSKAQGKKRPHKARCAGESLAKALAALATKMKAEAASTTYSFSYQRKGQSVISSGKSG
jgi:hypothetical protein